MSIRITANTAQAQALARHVRRSFSPSNVRKVVRREAFRTQKVLVLKTPKKWTGQTRRSWSTVGIGLGYQVTNVSKVMKFLEVGTRAHGPVRAKALFIPLNRKAAVGGWNSKLKYGKDYILRKWVKGIAPMHIVRDERPRAEARLHRGMRAYTILVLRQVGL